MKMTARASLIVLVILLVPGIASPVTPNCQFGRVQGFVQIRDNPDYLVGTIPSTFTSDARFFSRRYNCKRLSAEVRRVDLGTYDVRLPGLGNRAVFVSAVSLDGVSTSAAQVSLGVYRVVLRGPLVRNDVLVLRDMAFALAVF